jgi:hypothetical protein
MIYITPLGSAEYRVDTYFPIMYLTNCALVSHNPKYVATENLNFNLVYCPSSSPCRFNFVYGSNLITCPPAQMSLETGFYMLNHIHIAIGPCKSSVNKIFR